MIDVLIIDSGSQIKCVLSTSKIPAKAFNDEVKALNELEQSASVLVLLHHDVRKEQTADYIRLVVNANPQSKVVVLADELSEDEVLSCLLAGAHGYQQIDGLESCSHKLVKVMGDGEVWITRKMTARLLDALRS